MQFRIWLLSRQSSFELPGIPRQSNTSQILSTVKQRSSSGSKVGTKTNPDHWPDTSEIRLYVSTSKLLKQMFVNNILNDKQKDHFCLPFMRAKVVKVFVTVPDVLEETRNEDSLCLFRGASSSQVIQKNMKFYKINISIIFKFREMRVLPMIDIQGIDSHIERSDQETIRMSQSR